MSRYQKDMEGVFQRGKRGEEPVSMIYDRPKSYTAIRRMNRRLAKYNLVFRTYSGKGFWRRRGRIVPLDMTRPVVKGWLIIADTIVFDVGGGCQ